LRNGWSFEDISGYSIDIDTVRRIYHSEIGAAPEDLGPLAAKA
jgi:hypothetical protein